MTREQKINEIVKTMSGKELEEKHIFADENDWIYKQVMDSISRGSDIGDLQGQVGLIYWQCCLQYNNKGPFENYFRSVVSKELEVYKEQTQYIVKMPSDLAKYAKKLRWIKMSFFLENRRDPDETDLRNYKPFLEMSTKGRISVDRLVKLYYTQQGKLSLDYQVDPDDESVTLGDSIADPNNFEDDIDFKLDLESFLESLPEKHAKSIRMWMDGYTPQETAQKLEVSDQSIRNWLAKYKPKIFELRDNGAG